MHVHELNPKKTLAVAIIFVVVIVVGFLTTKQPRIVYNTTVKQSVKQLQNKKDAYFYPYQLVNFLNHQDKNIVLIDIRNKFVYGQGHIPGSENISAVGLANEKNLERLEDFKKNGITVVLYGKDQLQANGPWMLFRQIGFNNVKVLLGGYDYYKAHKDDLVATKGDSTYLKGVALYDYAKVAKSSAKSSVTNTAVKKPVIVRRRKKAAAVSGGC